MTAGGLGTAGGLFPNDYMRAWTKYTIANREYKQNLTRHPSTTFWFCQAGTTTLSVTALHPLTAAAKPPAGTSCVCIPAVLSLAPMPW